jgi:hypothetical protein
MVLRRLYRPAVLLGGLAVMFVTSCRDSLVQSVYGEVGGDVAGRLAGQAVTADTSGRWWGTFALGDVADSAIGNYPVLEAVLAGHFCDAIDHNNHVCAHASDVAATRYPTGVIVGPVVTSQVTGDAQGTIRGPTAQTIYLNGVFQGDSIVGSA